MDEGILPLHEKLPRLTVSTALGPLKLSSYEQRRNLLILLLDPAQPANRRYLKQLAALNDELAQLSTSVLVISPGDTPGEVPAAFRSAADPDSKFRRHYLPEDAGPETVGIWLSDRFGELYHQSIATNVAALTQPDEVLKWAQLVDAQCP